MSAMGHKKTAQRLEEIEEGEESARLERVRRHERFEIFKGTVRGEERKGRVPRTFILFGARVLTGNEDYS